MTTRAQSPEWADRPMSAAGGITLGADLLAGYEQARYIQCNVSGTYRLYDGTGYSEPYLAAGAWYEETTTKIVAAGTTGTAIADNALIVKGP